MITASAAIAEMCRLRTKLGIIAVIVIIAWVVLLQFRSREEVNVAQAYWTITDGMLKEDVQATLGSGESCTFAKQRWPLKEGVAVIHRGRTASVVIWYDDDQKVRSKVLMFELKQPVSWWRKMLSWWHY